MCFVVVWFFLFVFVFILTSIVFEKGKSCVSIGVCFNGRIRKKERNLNILYVNFIYKEHILKFLVHN